ncbi:CheR family methyltransferase [Caldithrix abyssi]
MKTEAPLLTDEAFDKISELVHRRVGIVLTTQKRSLVLARLQSVLREHGIVNFEDYLKFLKNDASGRALNTFINRIATNHTFFNREAPHFEFLKKVALPQLMESAGRHSRLHLWSAGCSSGEEPYQMAMELIEVLGETAAAEKAAILATDISTAALNRAQIGIYDRENVQHLPSAYRLKYFLPVDENNFQIKPALQRLILFKRLNLVRPHFPFKKQFHVVFCRNVMIYFDQETRASLIAKFYRYLAPGGYLMLGHSESIPPGNRYFKYVRPAIYRKEE